MAHLLDINADGSANMVSGNGILPWHKLGKVVAGALTAQEALELSGQNWRVKKVPIWAPGYDYDAGNPQDFSGKLYQSNRDYAIVREGDNRILGSVGAKYTPLQNSEAFRFFDALVTRGEAVYHTAGILDGGRVTWVLAQLPEDIVLRTPTGEQDITKKYVLLYNSFDGRSGVVAKLTACRVVCNNTLQYALNGKEPKFSIPHTASVEQQVAMMAKDMGLVNKTTEAFTLAAQRMIDTQVRSEDQVLDFLRACYEPGYKTRVGVLETDAELEQVEEAPKLARAVGRARELFETGKGMDLAPNSVWNLYQSVVEEVDHFAKYRSDDGRLRAAWFGGSNYDSKLRAFDKALELINA